MDESPKAQPLCVVSPSSFEVINACPLRHAFTQAAHGTGESADAARLGTVCHTVLEGLVNDRLLQGEVYKDEFSARFEHELAAQEEAAGRKLRRVNLTRARLGKVAARIAALLAELPAGAELLTEQRLVAAEGTLVGQIDLIVRSPNQHLVLDYKTGSVTEAGADRPKERYRRQLMLYACLEQAAIDAWPDRAILMPFGGEPVVIDIIPAECEALLEEALAAVAEWTTWVDSPPPARPSPDACRWCPYAARCGAFWSAVDASWGSELLAARGIVKTKATAPLGGVTVTVDSDQGSLVDTVRLRNADPEEHPALAAVEPGAQAAFVGLRPDPGEQAFTLGLGARIATRAAG